MVNIRVFATVNTSKKIHTFFLFLVICPSFLSSLPPSLLSLFCKYSFVFIHLYYPFSLVRSSFLKPPFSFLSSHSKHFFFDLKKEIGTIVRGNCITSFYQISEFICICPILSPLSCYREVSFLCRSRPTSLLCCLRLSSFLSYVFGLSFLN